MSGPGSGTVRARRPRGTIGDVRHSTARDDLQPLLEDAAHYPGGVSTWLARVPRVPALAVLGVRALAGAWWALRTGPVARGLALVAGVSLVDAIGAAAGPAVYRAVAT